MWIFYTVCSKLTRKMDSLEAMRDRAVEQAGKVLTDPEASEEDKNGISMVAAMLDIICFKYPEEEKLKWEGLQRPILETLKFEGCNIMTYDPKQDGLAGCYMLWLNQESNPTWTVKIDIEDSTSLDKIKCFVLDIVKLGEEEDEDDHECHGAVKTIEQVRFVCQLIKAGKVNDANQYIKDNDPYP
jgi:hypothetical protein